jgi:hypothetical protein
MSRLRLHKSSIVIGLATGIGLVLIEVPGRISREIQGTYASTVFEHGWPWVYLRRDMMKPPFRVIDIDGLTLTLGSGQVVHPMRPGQNRPFWSVPRLNSENWKFWEADGNSEPRRWTLRPIAAFGDLAMAVAAVVGSVMAWETRRRRCPRLLTFRLTDILVAVGALSIGLGWLTYHHNGWSEEMNSTDSGPMWGVTEESCVAPHWLQSLIGSELLPGFFWRASAAEIYTGEVEDADQIADEISELKYVTRTALWDAGDRFRFSAFRKLTRLETLELWGFHTLDEHELNELGQLKQLKKIVFEDIDGIAPEVLVSRLETDLPDCNIVDARDDW